MSAKTNNWGPLVLIEMGVGPGGLFGSATTSAKQAPIELGAVNVARKVISRARAIEKKIVDTTAKGLDHVNLPQESEAASAWRVHPDRTIRIASRLVRQGQRRRDARTLLYGGVASGAAWAYGRHQEKAKREGRDLSSRVTEILFGQKDPAVHRVIDATSANIERPELPHEKEIVRIAKRNSLLRRARKRALAIGVGGGVGAFLGHRLGGARATGAGALTGAVVGALLFQTREVNAAVSAALEFAAKLETKTL